jgi:hypothetical protein
MKTLAYACGVGIGVSAALVALYFDDAFREILQPPALKVLGVALVGAIPAVLVLAFRQPRCRKAASILSVCLTAIIVAWTVNVAHEITALYRIEGAVAYACGVNLGSKSEDVFRLTAVRVPADVQFECRADHRHAVFSRPFAGTAFFSFAGWSYQYDVARFILTD